MRSIRAAAVLALALALPATGCAFEESSAEEASLDLPLITTGPDGAVYRLRGTFEITRPDGTTLDADAGIEGPSVSLTLNPGLHSIHLADGWTLERSRDSGATYQPVNAILGSGNPATIRLVPNRQVSVSFQFFVREPTGTLNIRFGVSTSPRQLSGGLRLGTATGAYAAYAGQRIDIQIYFDGAEQNLVTEADGSRARVYAAGENAFEIYNDTLGLLAPVAQGFAGGWLEHTIRVKPDGTFGFDGRYDGFNGATLTFTPSMDAFATVGPDGFPADAFFYASGSTLELTTPQGSVSGFLSSIRHFQ